MEATAESGKNVQQLPGFFIRSRQMSKPQFWSVNELSSQGPTCLLPVSYVALTGGEQEHICCVPPHYN